MTDSSLCAFLAFGRDGSNDDPDPQYEPWWPLFIEDGPHLAESPEACIETIRERLALGGENQWTEIAVVRADAWTGE